MRHQVPKLFSVCLLFAAVAAATPEQDNAYPIHRSYVAAQQGCVHTMQVGAECL